MTPEEIEAKVRAFLQNAKGLAADGLTMQEFASLTVDLLRLCISAADSLPTDGAAKKAFVVQSAALLFDAVADRLIPLPGVPLWFLFRPVFRAAFIAAADGMIERLLPLVRAAK